MALKKWVSLARLQEYDALNKNLIGTKLSLPKDSEGNMIEPTEGQVYGYTDGRFNWITPITSWEQLEDKPFGVCETEKFEPATVNENTPHFTDSNGTKWYKISDATPAMNDLDTVMYNPNGTGNYAYAHTLSHGSTSTCWWDQIWSFLMVFYSTTAVGYNGTTYEVPSTGVYVPENRISWWFKILNTKRIDEEYIPDTIARVTDIPEVLGNVGQGTKSVAFNGNAAKNATGKYSFAEGTQVQASGEASHAEGSYTVASGMISHAEGSGTIASGTVSHAEGSDTESSGRYSHAEGSGTLAAGNVSHAEGLNTYAHSANQHVQGKYNEADTSEKYAHIVGNGTSNSDRSNAHTLDWSGNAWFAGDVYTGGIGQDDTENVKKLATEDYINENAEIVPIDKLTDYGATVDVTEGVGTKTYRNYVIYLNSNMSNPINKIFKIDMPDDKETSGYMIKFASANGTTSAGIYYETNRIRAAYLMFHKVDSTNSFQIINLVTGTIVEIEYDTDGNLVNNWTTKSTNAENVLTHLNKKAKSDSYVPSLDTDVATKGYVDDEISSKVVQSDWNQSDETAADYIKNKTHFSVNTETEILPLEEREMSYQGLYYGIDYNDIDENANPLVEGQQYKVIWNENEYIVTCIFYDANANNSESDYHYVLGNFNYSYNILPSKPGNEGYGEYTEPFLIIYDCAYKKLSVRTNTSSSVTFGLYALGEEVHQLDEKYIPDTVARIIPGWTADNILIITLTYDEENNKYVSSINYDEIMNAINIGKNPIMFSYGVLNILFGYSDNRIQFQTACHNDTKHIYIDIITIDNENNISFSTLQTLNCPWSYDDNDYIDPKEGQVYGIKHNVPRWLDLTAIPINRLVYDEYGGRVSYSVLNKEIEIYLSSSMGNPAGKLFEIEYNNTEYDKCSIRFTSTNGTDYTIYEQTNEFGRSYITINKVDGGFVIYDVLLNSKIEITFDSDGNYTSHATINNVTSSDIVTKLNTKIKADSYTPSTDYDVATKKYVDDNATSLSKFVFNISTEDDITFTADKTFAEIQEAYNAGKDIIAVWSIEGTEYNFTLQKFWADEEICFVLWPNHSGMMMHFYIKPDNTIEWFYDNMLEDHRYSGFTTASKQIVPAINEVNAKVNGLSTLPTVTEADNGKILQVVNGQWALVDPSTLVTDDGNGNVTLGGNTALNGNEVEY